MRIKYFRICWPLILLLLMTSFSFASEKKLVASDAVPLDIFGFSVAIDGTTAVFASIFHEHSSGINPGSVYVYAITPTGTTLQGELLLGSDDAPDGFGYDVAISGDYIAVGAPNAESGVSAVYIFKRTGTSWSLDAKITQPHEAISISVALDGDYLVVGNVDDDDNGYLSGAAYVYHRSGSSWALDQKLTPSDGGTGDFFGVRVAISGNRILVGAIGDNDNGAASGAAYFFERGERGWSETAKVGGSDSATGDNFGGSVDIDGDWAVVGSSWHNSGVGAAYVFKYTDSWQEDRKLQASDESSSVFFGHSVSLAVNGGNGRNVTVISGAPGANSAGGAAYVYSLSLGVWNETKLTASDGALYDSFGQDVAMAKRPKNWFLSGPNIGLSITGAPGADLLGKEHEPIEDAGAAYVNF